MDIENVHADVREAELLKAADYKDGILSVHMPKKAVTEQTGHTIAIGA